MNELNDLVEIFHMDCLDYLNLPRSIHGFKPASVKFSLYNIMLGYDSFASILVLVSFISIISISISIISFISIANGATTFDYGWAITTILGAS